MALKLIHPNTAIAFTLATLMMIAGCAPANPPTAPKGPSFVRPSTYTAPVRTACHPRSIPNSVVTVAYRISPDGRAEGLTIVTADHPGIFDELALGAINSWRWTEEETAQAAGGLQRVRFNFPMPANC